LEFVILGSVSESIGICIDIGNVILFLILSISKRRYLTRVSLTTMKFCDIC